VPGVSVVIPARNEQECAAACVAEAVAGLKLDDGLRRFLPMLLKRDGWDVEEVPVSRRARRLGRTKHGIRNRLFRWRRRRWLRYRVEERIE